MQRIFGQKTSGRVGLPTCIFSISLTLGMAVSHNASAATKEVFLASTTDALTYCQSGKMPAGDIAYIAGAGGLAQYGPDANCVQQVPPRKTIVTETIQNPGTKVSECKMVKAKTAIAFCQSGGMGQYDIAYISGKVGETMSGPGYGCVVNHSTSGIGNALCK